MEKENVHNGWNYFKDWFVLNLCIRLSELSLYEWTLGEHLVSTMREKDCMLEWMVRWKYSVGAVH